MSPPLLPSPLCLVLGRLLPIGRQSQYLDIFITHIPTLFLHPQLPPTPTLLLCSTITSMRRGRIHLPSTISLGRNSPLSRPWALTLFRPSSHRSATDTVPRRQSGEDADGPRAPIRFSALLHRRMRRLRMFHRLIWIGRSDFCSSSASAAERLPGRKVERTRTRSPFLGYVELLALCSQATHHLHDPSSSSSPSLPPQQSCLR